MNNNRYHKDLSDRTEEDDSDFIKFRLYLQSQFSDLKGAKKFYKKWRDEWGQEIPEHPEWGIISLRAMAAHCSHSLEKTIPPKEAWATCYLKTKYGATLYLETY